MLHTRALRIIQLLKKPVRPFPYRAQYSYWQNNCNSMGVLKMKLKKQQDAAPLKGLNIYNKMIKERSHLQTLRQAFDMFFNSADDFVSNRH